MYLCWWLVVLFYQLSVTFSNYNVLEPMINKIKSHSPTCFLFYILFLHRSKNVSSQYAFLISECYSGPDNLQIG